MHVVIRSHGRIMRCTGGNTAHHISPAVPASGGGCARRDVVKECCHEDWMLSDYGKHRRSQGADRIRLLKYEPLLSAIGEAVCHGATVGLGGSKS